MIEQPNTKRKELALLLDFASSKAFQANNWDEEYMEYGRTGSTSRISEFKSELIENYLASKAASNIRPNDL